MAAALLELGRLHYMQKPGDPAGVDSAEVAWTEALALQRAALAPRDPRLTARLWNLGNVAFLRSEYVRAESLYAEVLAIREAAYGPDHHLVADVKTVLAAAIIELNRYREAREILSSALPVLERELGPDHPWVLDAVGVLGRVDFDLAYYAESDSLLGRALAAHERLNIPLDSTSAVWARVRALALINRGRQMEGEELLRETLVASSRVEPPLTLARVFLLSELADLELSRGETASARRTMARALEELGNSPFDGSPVHAGALYDLGRVQAADGSRAAAALTFAQSDSLYAAGPERGSQRHARVTLARAALSPKEADAETLAREALAALERQLGSGHPAVGDTRLRLARIVEESRGSGAARGEFEAAVRILESCQEGDAPGLAKARAAFAECLVHLRDFENAWDQAIRAEAAGRSFARRTLMRLPDDRTLPGISGRADARGTLLTILAAEPTPDRIRIGWEAVIGSRGLVFDELCRRRRTLLNSRDPATRSLTREWLETVGRVASLEVRAARGEAVTPYLQSAREDAERIERALLPRGEDNPAPDAPLLSELRRGLPKDHVLCAFVRYTDVRTHRSAYAVFLMGQGAPAFLALGDAEAIDADIFRMTRELGGASAGSDAAEERYRKAAAKVREAVWDPLLPYVDGARGVLMVADGLTSRIAWGSLPEPGRRYLVENELRLHVLATERELSKLSETGSEGDGLLVLGDPDFGASRSRPGPVSDFAGLDASGCRALFSWQWARLPATATEVREISSFWREHAGSSSRVLTGGNATEAQLRRHAPGKRAIHLATHGFVLDACAPNTDLRGLGGLVPESDSQRIVALSDEETLTGLVLADANVRARSDDGDDGILTALEVAALDLSGVDWAVLSACATALGDIHPGEGVFSMGRAFRIAGARTVVVGLWSLEDAATRQWMRALYEGRLGAGLSNEDAVRFASLRVLEARRREGRSTHPFYWGGFIAIGDWR